MIHASSDKTVSVTCPNCQRTHDAGKQRSTDWCPACYREWLKDYPANVCQEYAALFSGKLKEENHAHRTGVEEIHAPFTQTNKCSML